MMVKLDDVGPVADTVITEVASMQSWAMQGYRPLLAFEEKTRAIGVWNSQTQSNESYDVVTTKFLMVRGGESELLTDLRNKADFSATALSKANTALREAEAAKKTAEAHVENLKRNNVALEAGQKDLHKSLEETRTRSRKMENDIAKLRQALGELRMKEILDGK
jgi:peptidoglycan hydrolase CwlO-like protein